MERTKRAGLDEQERGRAAAESHGNDSPSRPHENARPQRQPYAHVIRRRRRPGPSPRVIAGCTSLLVTMVLLTLLLWCLGSSFLLFYGTSSSEMVGGTGVLVLPERTTAASSRAVDPGFRGRSERDVWHEMKATLERRFGVVAATVVDKHRALSEGNLQLVYPSGGASKDTRLLQSIQKAMITTESSSCMLPLTTSSACQATHFAVIAVVWEIVSSDHPSPNTVPTWHRTMFLNCLQWMAVPSVSDIFILLPNSQQQSLAQENATYYGQRILHWHQQLNHPVRLVFGTSLGEALSQMPPQPPFAAVLWTTANQEFRGNSNGLQQGFARWKSQPAVPVAAAVWQFQYHHRQHPQHLSSSIIHNTQQNQTISSNSHNNNASTISEDDNLVSLPEVRLISAMTNNQTMMAAYDGPDDKHPIPLHPSRLPVWFDLSVATFHDWNYLCFLLKHHHQQHALDPLWQILDDPNDTWKAARWALEGWLSLAVPTDHLKVNDSFSADTRTLHDVSFFDLYSRRSNATDSSAGEALKRNGIASPAPVLALEEGMRDIVSLFGGIPPVADETGASLISSRRPEDHEMLDLIVC